MDTQFPNLAAIILAGGKGTRMQSNLPKVLHKLGGKPIVAHILKKLQKLQVGQIIVVTGYESKKVQNKLGPDWEYAIQVEQLGTGHAAQQAFPLINNNVDHVLVVNGDDSAFYQTNTLKTIINKHLNSSAKMTMLSTIDLHSEVAGRVKRNKNGRIEGVLPKSQMTAEDYANNHEVVCGLYLFEKKWLLSKLPQVEKSKAGEYNITTLIDKAVQSNQLQSFILEIPGEWQSINDPKQLKKARRLWKKGSYGKKI